MTSDIPSASDEIEPGSFDKWKTPSHEAIVELQHLLLAKRKAEEEYTHKLKEVAQACTLSPAILNMYLVWKLPSEPSEQEQEQSMQFHFLQHTVDWPLGEFEAIFDFDARDAMKREWEKQFDKKKD